MKKDFSKKRSHQSRSLSGVWIATGIFLFSLALLIAYGYKYSNQTSFVSLQYAHFSNWLDERKGHLKKDLAKAKQLTKRKSEPPPPIHFEFYTSLSNMKMKTPESSENTTIIANKKNVSQKIFMNPDDIEQEFAKQIKQKH